MSPDRAPRFGFFVIMRLLVLILSLSLTSANGLAQQPKDNSALPNVSPSTAASGFWNLRATDLIQLLGALVMIWVVAKAPGWAVRAQWQLQLQKEGRDRKLWVFKTLMRTRSTPTSGEHVQALNLIDVEFSSESRTDTGIREAWSSLLANLSVKCNLDDQAQISAWCSKNQDLLIELLSKMGRALGYDFSFTHLKDRGYNPRIHGELDEAIIAVNKGWAEVLDGRRPLKMEIVKFPTQQS